MSAPGRAGGFLALIGACVGLVATRAVVGDTAPPHVAAPSAVVPMRPSAAPASHAPVHVKHARTRPQSRPEPTTSSRAGVPGVAKHQARRTTPATTLATEAAPDRTVTGTPQQTQFGPLQVQVVLRGSEVVDADALVYPADDARSRQINADALPVLRQQVLNAQSADIDGVSGATVTSDAYALSVQSALDRA